VTANGATDSRPTAAVVARINALTGRSYRLGERLDSPSGRTWVVRDGDHASCLKWFPGMDTLAQQRAAADTCEHLRGLGSPVPRYHQVDEVDGDGFVLMDFMAGHPVGRTGGLSERQARHLVELIELQAGAGVLAPPDPEAVVSEMVDFVHHGPLLDHIRSNSEEASQLLGRAQAIAWELRGIRLPGGDIEHKDMNPSNLIVDSAGGHHITGIVDWETTATGDRGGDVAAMMFYLWGGDPAPVREVLWDHLVAISTEEARSPRQHRGVLGARPREARPRLSVAPARVRVAAPQTRRKAR